jgi:protein-tyrosine phosphatase
VSGGITHTLNVGSGPCNYNEPPRFKGAVWHRIEDLRRIPDRSVRFCLDTIFTVLASDQTAKVYVHCAAGQNRSPNILWLFLIGCGLSPEDAAARIVERAIDAVPGHARMVDEDLIELARAHGETKLRPVPPGVLDPIV